MLTVKAGSPVGGEIVRPPAFTVESDGGADTSILPIWSGGRRPSEMFGVDVGMIIGCATDIFFLDAILAQERVER